MSYPAKTLFGFGCYLLVLGMFLIVFPNTVLELFRVAPTVEVWIRVVGMLVLILGAYDVLASLSELHQFIRWSVPMRASVIFFFAVFVLLGYAPPVLLLFGLIDLACAAWTWFALHRTRGAALEA
jgi:Na+/alanine symporter